MKGWVYVISNKAMDGVVKIGYSTKDPELRAQELNHTGSPHPYSVEYEMLIEEPYRVEQATHKILSEFHEGKEWFRCTLEQAVTAIRQVAENKQILDKFSPSGQEYIDKTQKLIDKCSQCGGVLLKIEKDTLCYKRCKECGQVFPEKKRGQVQVFSK